jgi:hypothetical protein
MNTPRFVFTTISALLFALPAFALTDTWDGGDVNDIFTSPQNWLDNTAPASDLANTDLIFAGAIRPTPTLNAPFSARGITFDNTATAFTILGDQLNVGSGGITNGDNQTMSFVNIVNFGGVAVSSVDASNGGLTFGNAIGLPTGLLIVDGLGATNFQEIAGASTTALGKFGSGTMTWNPVGPVPFDVEVLEGALTIGGDGTSNFLASTASIDVTRTSVLNIDDSLTLDGAQITRSRDAVMNLAAGKTLNVFNGADVDITGAFEVNGANILVSGSGSTFSAETFVVSSGTLIVSAGGDVSVSTEFSLGTSGSATLTIENGGTFTTGSNLTTISDTGDLNINAGGTMMVRGEMTVFSSLDIGGTVILGATASPTPNAIGTMPESNLSFDESDLSASTTITNIPEPGIGSLLASAIALLRLRHRESRNKKSVTC